MTALLRRFDRAFSRTFTAMAMAEDGTRDLAMEFLEGVASGEAGAGDNGDPDDTDSLPQSA